MALYFGMRFERADGGRLPDYQAVRDYLAEAIAWGWPKARLYVDAGSVTLLLARHRDVVRKDGRAMQVPPVVAAMPEPPYRIIERGGIDFRWPEQEQ